MTSESQHANNFTSRIPRPSSFGVRIENTADLTARNDTDNNNIANSNSLKKKVDVTASDATDKKSMTQSKVHARQNKNKENKEAVDGPSNNNNNVSDASINSLRNKRKQAAINTTKPSAPLKKCNTTGSSLI